MRARYASTKSTERTRPAFIADCSSVMLASNTMSVRRDGVTDCEWIAVVSVSANRTAVRLISFRRREGLQLLLDRHQLRLRFGDDLALRCRRWEEASLLRAGSVEEPGDAAELGANPVTPASQPALERDETTGIGTGRFGAT